MAVKPAAVIQIALYADGRVQSGLEGSGDKGFIAKGIACALQAILNKIDEHNREPTIGIPPPDVARQLVAAR